MNFNLMDPKLIALAVVVVLIIVVGVALYMRKRKNTRQDSETVSGRSTTGRLNNMGLNAKRKRS